METQIQTNKSYVIRTETLQEKPHIVVPAIMIKEGVHNGNHGPILHLTKDLALSKDFWNGKPVTILHPQKDGQNISANSPDVVTVGRVFNAMMDEDKLKAEVWLDIEKMGQVSPEALLYIQAGRQLDVSTGMFVDEEIMTGEYNGESYTAIAGNIRPDHLALLPGEDGACSWDDGCGIRANSDKKVKKEDEEEEEEEEIKKKGSGMTRTRFSNNNVNKEESKMSEVKKTPCCEDLVNELITNKRTKFEEADKEQLLTLSEDLLSKLIPDEETKVDPKIEKTEKVALQINAEQALKVLKESMKTPEDFFKILPAEYQDSMRSGLTLHEARRAEMVKTIQDNLKEVWTEDELKTMDMVTLSKVHKGIPEAVDYSGNGGGIVQTNKAGGEPLYPVGVTFDNK